MLFRSADDLTQETFLCVYRRPFVERSPAATAAYLRTVARRQLLMSLRKAKRRPQLADLEPAGRLNILLTSFPLNPSCKSPLETGTVPKCLPDPMKCFAENKGPRHARDERRVGVQCNPVPGSLKWRTSEERIVRCVTRHFPILLEQAKSAGSGAVASTQPANVE